MDRVSVKGETILADDYYKKLAERAHEARIVRRIVIIVLCALIIFIGGSAGFGYYYIKHALQPVNPKSTKQVEVKIPMGSSASQIGTILQKDGIIRSGKIFHYYVKYKNQNGFQAGIYQFSPSNSIGDIIAKLKNGKVYKKVQLTLTIPEGFWTIDIAKRIASETNLKEKDILKKLSDKKYIKQTYMSKYPFLKDVILNKNIKYPLEGYLFPATYSFTKKNPTLEEMMTSMLDKTQSVLNKYQAQINNSQLKSVHQILTMASIIEEESPKEADRQKIASVFFNRLNNNMPLQTDPTVAYSEQKHITSYTEAELKVKSPYNTYLHTGLPPGPIANPGEASIQAALSPAKTNYLYFYARPNGITHFSKTLSEHNAYVKKYSHEWTELNKKQ